MDKGKKDKQILLNSLRKREIEREVGIWDIPASNTNIEAADDVVFFFRESTMFDVRP